MQNDAISGTVFRAKQNPELLVFVPDSYFLPDEESSQVDFRSFDQETFIISRWPRINALANNLESAIILLPDLENLLPDQVSEREDFRKFARALQQAIHEEV